MQMVDMVWHCSNTVDGLSAKVQRGEKAASLNIILSIVGSAKAIYDVSRALSCVEFLSVSLIVNGSLSPKFAMFCKFCKGCPLSPLLFIIATKVFRAIMDKFEIGFLKLQAVRWESFTAVAVRLLNVDVSVVDLTARFVTAATDNEIKASIK